MSTDLSSYLEQATEQLNLRIATEREWMEWIERLPDDIFVSAKEATDRYVSRGGLKFLERLRVDIYPTHQPFAHVRYDLKKLLRAVIVLPALSRFERVRDMRNTLRMAEKIVDKAVNGRLGFKKVTEDTKTL